MWNYRLFRQDIHYTEEFVANMRKGIPDWEGEKYFFFVGECYYDAEGKPEMHSTMEHNHVTGDSPEEVMEVMEMMTEAFKQPFIELDHEGNFKKNTKESTNNEEDLRK